MANLWQHLAMQAPTPSPTPAALVLHASGLQAALPGGFDLFHLPALTITPGITLVQGDEGVGKTTLLRVLAGEHPQQVAQAQLAGHDLHAAPDAYRAEVAWLDPSSAAWDSMVVSDLWAQQARSYRRWSADTLEDLVDALGLQAHRHKPLTMLSTGSRRKALLVAALSSGAALTLLDMPFAALDSAASRTLREVLADCATHPSRAFVLADYAAPTGVPLAQVIDLDARAAV